MKRGQLKDSEMTKAEMNCLEKAFAAEIEGRMFQSKSKLAASLADEGYLSPAVEKFPSALGEIVCHGWQLTHLGRITYCASC